MILASPATDGNAQMAPFCAAFMIKPRDTLATQIGGSARRL
jgi:hypothetical protein